MQARDKAGSLEIVGKVLPDELLLPDLEDDDLEEPTDKLGAGEELVGTTDAEELILADIGEGPEEVGLDVETGAEDERGEAAAGAELLDADDSEEGDRWALEDRIELESDLDLDDDDDEGGWTQDSEGMGGTFDEEVGLDDEESATDDGGLEGVDDPMLDDFAAEEDEDDDSSALG